MGGAWSMTFDCVDAPILARFWAVALGYVEAPPPEGWDSTEAWLRDLGVPEDEWDDGAALVDPAGVLPAISFLNVPEQKTAKNRIHLDVRVAGGRHVDQAVREERIRAKVEQLVGAGASVLRIDDNPKGLDHVVMADPEGNEFCVV